MDIHHDANIYLNTLINGSVRSVLLRGPHGIGKSTNVTNVLRKSEIPNDKIFIKSGYETMTSFFDHLEGIQEKLSEKYKVEVEKLPEVLDFKVHYVLDDASVLHSPDFKDQALLKSLWDDRKGLVTTYKTQVRCTKIYNDIFKFIIVMNGSMAGQVVHRKAIDDRLLVYEYNLDVNSVLRYAMSLHVSKVDSFEKEEFFKAFLESLKREIVGSGIAYLSIRQINKIFTLIDWREEMITPILSIEFPIDECYSSFLSIISNKDFENVTSMIIEFEKQTGLKKRTFFNYKKRYLSLMKVTEISLSDFYSRGTQCVVSEYDAETINSCGG